MKNLQTISPSKPAIYFLLARALRVFLVAAVAAGSLALPLSSQFALAEPVAPEDRMPMDFRRTSLIVDDIDVSLKLYRDALGMKVIYDKQFLTPRDAQSPNEATRHQRLVFLRANDNYIGVLGLLEYLKPKLKKPRLRKLEKKFHTFQQGDTVLVFNIDKDSPRKIRNILRQALRVKGVKLVSKPTKVSYPRYDNKGMIDVLVSLIRDPDGYMLEVNHVLNSLGMPSEQSRSGKKK